MALRLPFLSLPRLTPSTNLLRSTRTFSSTAALPLAKITVVGRLGADPELVPTSTGNPMVRYNIATSSGPNDNRQTNWWRVACFAEEGRSRDRVMGMTKGTLVYVEGEATMRKVESKEGKMESMLNIVQNKLEILRRPDAPAEE